MKITEITAEKKDNKIQRLAAYCRVSSDSADQLHSFAAQLRYYSNYEKQHPEFELVGIYADEGLLNKELAKCSSDHKATSQSKINEIVRLTDILENQPLQFNDELIRQMLQCIVVESKERIKVIFNDGTEIDQPIL